MNSRNSNRRGVTLLFVISMIVLFLLMGTTFVVISNDFRRSAQRQTRITVKTIESLGENRGEKFITQALYDLLRGPDLNNANSPLRGHSILADMYGYGFTAFVKDIENTSIEPGVGSTNNPQFLRLELIGPNINVYAEETIVLNDFNTSIAEGVFGTDIMTGEALKYTDIGNAPGRFNGQLLSFVTGPARGISSRIIDHQVFLDGGNTRHKFVILLLNAPTNIRPGDVVDNGGMNDLIISYDEVEANQPTDTRIPTRVVVNCRPFAGTGVGKFDPSSAANDNALGTDGFNPNQKGKTRIGLYRQPTVGGSGNSGNGYMGWSTGTDVPQANSYATNECYDAPDYNNMFLASIDDKGKVTIPSFHRPELAMLSSGNLTDYSFRPEFIPVDESDLENSPLQRTSSCNQRFGGANVVESNMLVPFDKRELDVDNDGVHGNDGIWMDIALPIHTNKEGRRIKTLVSYTVVDLDSRINIDVHGNRAQIPANNRFVQGNPINFLSETSVVPFGMGLGPSEIYLGAVLGDEEAEDLMVGQFQSGNDILIPGRYGSSENNVQRRFGGGPVPGQGYVDDNDLGQEIFSAYKLFGYPNYGLDPQNLSVLGGLYQSSPLDIYGRFKIGFPSEFFDMASPFQTSMPVIDVVESKLRYSEIINNPYEVNFSAPPTTGSFYDNLFTLEEMEAVYRRNDRDVKQRPLTRLARLAPSLMELDNHLLATTDSWEVPTTYQEFLWDANNARQETLMTKLYQVLATDNAGGSSDYGIPNDADKEQTIMANISGFIPRSDESFDIDPAYRSMLSPDVRSGRPFNVNQPFGDGLDDADDSDLVIDNPGEEDRLGHPDGSNPLFDHDQDSFILSNGEAARQLFARQLYILALLATELVDRNGTGSVIDGTDFPDFTDENGIPLSDTQSRLAYRRVVAQWAINVAEFRDPDSIMTPFEVDLNPWDGWDVDGDMTTNETTGANPPIPNINEYARLWGTERPELLITENIAIHDGREEDLSNDDGNMNQVADGDDLDSRLVPNASAFFELYHPWANSDDADNSTDDFPNQFLPAEFDLNQDGGVDLQQLAPNGAPVWRMVVANNARFDPSVFQTGVNGFAFVQDPDQENNLNGASIRRYVYFTTPTGAATGTEFDGPKAYAPQNAVSNAVVRPGGYAVIGSAGIESGTRYTTYLGRRQGATDANPDLQNTRRIVLDTGANTVSVFPGNDPTNASVANPDVVLPLSSVSTPDRSFGVTDPLNGYAFTHPIAPIIDGDGFFFVDNMGGPIVLDEPIDMEVNNSAGEFYSKVLQNDQLVSGVFVILLQRLANPLAEWDVDLNPYRTIDSTSGDVFAFTGTANNPNGTGTGELHFGTFERRANRDADFGQTDVQRARMLFKTDYSGLNPTSPTTDSNPTSGHFLNTELVHSLGSLNNEYITPGGSAPTPQIPFAWLTWNNRPYASALELANVPYTSSYFLTSRFDTSRKATSFNNNIYDPLDIPMGTGNVDHPDRIAFRLTPYSGEFPHLLNFHADQNKAFNLHRIFDYLEVPSRYIGTETYLNPGNFVSSIGLSTNGGLPSVRHSVSMSFAPPFDYVSNFRVPGKININTVTNEKVWNALMAIDPISTTPGRATFDNWRNSHDEWKNPYRIANARNLVPESMAGSSIPVQANQSDVGLFRRKNGSNDPLFDYDPANDPIMNTDRNAYFRYNDRQRLGNLVTMRSSVFAIWITVGYFEIETADSTDQIGNPIKIDVIGDEVEDDNGQTTRNRGFFVFDRSIPVAFEPGKNHNVERAIRVSSYIE